MKYIELYIGSAPFLSFFEVVNRWIWFKICTTVGLHRFLLSFLRIFLLLLAEKPIQQIIKFILFC